MAIEVHNNCDWSDAPRYFEYDEAEWKRFISTISAALDIPGIAAIQTYFYQGIWMEDESNVFDFCNCDASWMQGNTTISKHYSGGFDVVVMFFCKHNAESEFWADFIIM